MTTESVNVTPAIRDTQCLYCEVADMCANVQGKFDQAEIEVAELKARALKIKDRLSPKGHFEAFRLPP